jgi:hypothetical protein
MPLTARQNLVARSYIAISAKLGPWLKDKTTEGAYYIESSLNGAKDKGAVCANCVFWKAPNKCVIVKGAIERDGICKMNVIPNDRLKDEPLVTLRGHGRVSGSIG